MASAISSLTPLPYDANAPTQFLLGAGSYAGQPAMAVGLAYYANDSMMLNLGFSLSGGEKMGRLGAAWKLGQDAKKEKAAATNSGEVEALRIVQQQQAQLQQLQVQNARMQDQLDRLVLLMEKGRSQ